MLTDVLSWCMVLMRWRDCFGGGGRVMVLVVAVVVVFIIIMVANSQPGCGKVGGKEEKEEGIFVLIFKLTQPQYGYKYLFIHSFRPFL